MENELLKYVKGILCFVLFASLMMQLFPKQKDKKYLELTIGLIFLYVFMRPALSILKNYNNILNSSYFTMDFDSNFLEEQQEEFDIQTGMYIMNQMEEQIEYMGYQNPKLTMKRKGNSWEIRIELDNNLSNDWEEEKKNLKILISDVYNLEEDNINIEIRG